MSYTIGYSEAEDCLEIEIISAAKAEDFYMKRVYDFKSFMDYWKEHVEEMKKK